MATLRSWCVFGSLLAASLAWLTTGCHIGEEDPSPCDRSSVVFTLPAPGDTLVLTGTACIEGGTTGGLTVWAQIGDDWSIGEEPQVELTVEGDPSADIISHEGEVLAYATASAATCDAGLTISIVHVGEPAPLTGVLRFTGVGGEGWDRCDIALEVP